MKKINSLQGLRGWSITLIVLWHLDSVFPNCLPKTGDKGVEFFLLISGYLIALKCEKNNVFTDFDYSSKYVKDKIKSIYWLYVLFAIPVTIAILFSAIRNGTSLSIPIFQVVTYFTLTQSWIPNSRIYWGINGAAWFLPVIMYCYFMVPIIKRIVKRHGSSIILLICFCIQISSELLLKKTLPNDISTWFLYICPIYRAIDFTIGFCSYHIIIGNEELKKTNRDGIFLLIILLYIAISVFGVNRLGYVSYHPFEVLIMLIIVSGSSKIANELNNNEIAIYIGNISSIIFLTHLPVIKTVGILWSKLFGENYLIIQWGINIILILSVSIIISKRPWKKVIIKEVRKQ